MQRARACAITHQRRRGSSFPPGLPFNGPGQRPFYVKIHSSGGLSKPRALIPHDLCAGFVHRAQPASAARFKLYRHSSTDSQGLARLSYAVPSGQAKAVHGFGGACRSVSGDLTGTALIASVTNSTSAKRSAKPARIRWLKSEPSGIVESDQQHVRRDHNVRTQA